MKMTYRSQNGRLQFEADIQNAKQAFELMGKIQEIFEEPACGCCKSESIRCSTREHDSNMFYNLVCNQCGAQLDIGQRKDGKGMWLKRTDKDGNRLENQGWYVYQRGENNSAPARDTRPSEARNPFGGKAPQDNESIPF